MFIHLEDHMWKLVELISCSKSVAHHSLRTTPQDTFFGIFLLHSDIVLALPSPSSFLLFLFPLFLLLFPCLFTLCHVSIYLPHMMTMQTRISNAVISFYGLEQDKFRPSL